MAVLATSSQCKTILYVAHARSDAQLAATALRRVAPNVVVVWASHFDQAANWIREHKDLAALVVDAQIGNQRCTSFLQHVRTLGTAAPLVVVGPEEVVPQLEPLEAGAFDVVARNDALFRNLPAVVSRAIERAQARDVRRPVVATSDRPSLPPTGASNADSRQPAGQSMNRDGRSNDPVPAERPAALDELAQQERAAGTELRQKLARAEAALQDAELRHQSAMTTAAAQLAESQRKYEISMSRVAATWDMVNEQLREAAFEVEQARQRHASAAADAERLSRRESELTFRLAQVSSAQGTLEGRLAAAESALEAANDRIARERHGAEQAAGRQAELQARIDREVATRRRSEDELARVSAALQEAEKQHALATTTAATLLAARQAQFDADWAEAAAARDALAHRAGDLETALDRTRQELESHVATGERLARREAQLGSMLAEATAACASLEGRLAGTEAAFKDADERATRERLAASRKAAEREARLDGLIRQEQAVRAAVEQKLADAEQARLDAEQRHVTAMTSAAAELSGRQRELETALSETAAARDRFEQLLAEAQAAADMARQHHASAAAEADRLAGREAELASQLADAEGARSALERKLAEATAAHQDADLRAADDRQAAAARAAEREAELVGLIRDERAGRATVEQQLAHLEAALRDAEERHVRAMTAAASELGERQRQFEDTLSETAAARDTLERQLADAAAAIRDADERAASERAEAAARGAALEAQLTETIERRDALQRDLDGTRSAAASLEDQLARERLDAESRLEGLRDQLRTLALERDALGASLDAHREESHRTGAEHRAERESLERARLAAVDDVQQLAAELAELQHGLEEARHGFQQTLDRVAGEHASAAAALEATVAEREAQLDEQAARHSASMQAAAGERAQLEDGFRTTLAARDREIERLRRALDATTKKLDQTRTRRDVLQVEADRVPRLQEQLHASHAEIRRQFADAPLALCRCSRAGALLQANRAFAALVGYRDADELRSIDFAATLFESPDDLSWLIERCVRTRARASVETTWVARHGGRLVVRLSACASDADVIEIVAEDLTSVRALQDRLAQAHRMEAVGRLASEVAVTCGNLLRDVHQDAQRWLATAGANAALQRQGDMLLEEVTRATSFLRQLAAYSDEETSALVPVDLNRVLRDLAPVLKRVAGNDIEIELPKTSSTIDVDVRADRVERLLVNLAGYGRQRMPSGGRLRIELATVVVGRGFSERHPGVRQGAHALITVTEVRRAARTEGLLQLGDGSTGSGADASAADRPGVDLGALQELIRGCSGHLWMTVEPSGYLVAKIHLPLRASDGRARARGPLLRSRPGRHVARWFQQ